MKKNTKSNQSSVPVQHSHTTAETAKPARNGTPDTDPNYTGRNVFGNPCPKNSLADVTPPAATAPDAERKDNRLPIDAEARKKNRTLPTQTVVQRLATIPTAAQCATIVGKWVWVQFAEQPAAEVRQQLAQLGFHWNRERQAWQHPCGAFSTAARTHDPRDFYGNSPITTEAAA